MQRIFIGDVQGCSDELEELIDRAEAEFGNEFSLWVAGDLVNRGPGNLRALERVRELVEAGRGELILGNHEIFLISVALGVRELRPLDSIEDVLGAPDVDEWVDWLRARPLACSGTIGGQAFVMLHASVHPDWTLAEVVRAGNAVSERLSGTREAARQFLLETEEPGTARDLLSRLTRGRTVDAQGRWLSEEPSQDTRPWHVAWAERDHDYGIVYGHWARQGLHVVEGLRGLDSGCVHHGRGRDGFLTAWLPESAPVNGGEIRARTFDVPDGRLWQIPARRRYYDPDSTPCG